MRKLYDFTNRESTVQNSKIGDEGPEDRLVAGYRLVVLVSLSYRSLNSSVLLWASLLVGLSQRLEWMGMYGKATEIKGRI
jgi:hypothetical protein